MPEEEGVVEAAVAGGRGGEEGAAEAKPRERKEGGLEQGKEGEKGETAKQVAEPPEHRAVDDANAEPINPFTITRRCIASGEDGQRRTRSQTASSHSWQGNK